MEQESKLGNTQRVMGAVGCCEVRKQIQGGVGLREEQSLSQEDEWGNNS